MKRLDFVSPGARLEDALKQLEAAWQATKTDWDDAVSQRVEDEYLLKLRGQVRALLDGIGRTGMVLRKAEQECRHPREQ
ncbi:MAG: hypothetical protein RL215_3449 [Planctomycetota bacterium]|jgi:hypothetical protein